MLAREPFFVGLSDVSTIDSLDSRLPAESPGLPEMDCNTPCWAQAGPGFSTASVPVIRTVVGSSFIDTDSGHSGANPSPLRLPRRIVIASSNGRRLAVSNSLTSSSSVNARRRSAFSFAGRSCE